MHESFERAERQSNRLMIGVLLAIVLPCLLGAAWLSYRTISYQHFAQETTGTVVEISGSVPALVVEFDAGGDEPRRTTSAGSDLNKNFAVGDRIKVWFDPQQPQDARLDLFVENWLFPLLLGVFGGFFALPLLFMADLRIFGRSRSSQRLEGGGARVMAEFVDVRPEMNFAALRKLPRALGSVSLSSENGRYTLTHNGQSRDPFDPVVQRELGLSYVLHAKWRDAKSGIEYFYESEPLTDNPERYLKGRQVPVFIDPSSPQRYRMDLSFLPGRSARENSVIEG